MIRFFSFYFIVFSLVFVEVQAAPSKVSSGTASKIAYLQNFPKTAFHQLNSNKQIIGKAAFSWAYDSGQLEFVENSEMKLTLYKQAQTIKTLMNVWTDSNLLLERFNFEMQSSQANLQMSGIRAGSQVKLKVTQAGSTQARDIQVQEPLLLSPMIRPFVLMKGLPAKTVVYRTYLLEPSAMTTVPMTLTVKKIKKDRWSLDVAYLNQSLVSEIDRHGSVIVEKTDLAGLPIVARPITKQGHSVAKLEGTKDDLVELSKVTFPKLSNSKKLNQFKVRIKGIDLPSFQLTRHRQELNGNILNIQVESIPVKSVPVQNLITRKDLEHYLKGDTSIPVHEPVIQKKAQAIVGEETDIWKRAMLIHQFVFDYLKKIPTISVPNALEVLETKKGDCNEHAVLYTALARAAGIPTRTVVGLVYSDTFYGDPGFYYHAWVEVFEGKRWIALDPTWNQVPADATHIAFVEGELDQQVQITSLMGKIRLEPVAMTN